MMPLATPGLSQLTQPPARNQVPGWHPQAQMLRRQPIRAGSAPPQSATDLIAANLLCF